MKVYVLIEDFDNDATEVVGVYSYAHLAEDRFEYEVKVRGGSMRIVECELVTFWGGGEK